MLEKIRIKLREEGRTFDWVCRTIGVKYNTLYVQLARGNCPQATLDKVNILLGMSLQANKKVRRDNH